VPALYIAGDRDLVVTGAGGPNQIAAHHRKFVPKLKTTVILQGCGHWTQQERPGEVNAAIINFLGSL
jgi:pimeloyl-ACP methyl ester carboxylesterase